MTPWPTCVLVHRQDGERLRPAMDGAHVCYGCHAKTLRAALQLPPLHRLLGELPAISTAAPRNGSRSTELPIPLHPAAADLRMHMRVKMAGWIPIVTDQRGLTTPRIDAVDGSQRAMDQIAAWLLPHHDWLLYTDPEGYAADLGDLHSAAWGIAYPSGRSRREFAPCPTEDCGGTLCAWLAPGDLLPKALACDTCGAEVAPSKWLTGRTAHQPWLTAVELAALWTVPVGTVWRWASLDNWERIAGNPTLYDSGAAQASHDSRRVMVDN
jgi:hypothetical protein